MYIPPSYDSESLGSSLISVFKFLKLFSISKVCLSKYSIALGLILSCPRSELPLPLSQSIKSVILSVLSKNNIRPILISGALLNFNSTSVITPNKPSTPINKSIKSISSS